jgi:hypothetical protein
MEAKMRRQVLSMLILSLLVVNLRAFGQQVNTGALSPQERALQELDSIQKDSARLKDSLAYVRVRAKMANLVWLHDPGKARVQFRDLWKWIREQKEKDFKPDAANRLFLSALFPRDPKMAGKYLEETLGEHKSEEAPLFNQATGQDPNLQQLAKLANDALATDEKMAADFLQRSLAVSITPGAFVALTRLREKNAILADYVAGQALEGLKQRPSIIGLTGVDMFIDYVFPSNMSFAEKITEPTDAALRVRFFSVAHGILKMSLEENDAVLQKEKGYKKAELGVRSVYQAMTAAVLAALSTEYAPELSEELKGVAAKLSVALPPQFAQSLSYKLARLSKEKKVSEEDPNIAISTALANGDLDDARKLIDGLENEQVKRVYTTLLTNVEFKMLMAESALAEAMIVARKVEDPSLRAIQFAQIARAAFAKKEMEFFRLVISEARASLAGSDWNGLHARCLLLLTSEVAVLGTPETLDLLWGAVASINHTLKKQPLPDEPKNAVLEELNKPGDLIEAPELQQAFFHAGNQDLETSLLAAYRIEDLAIGLVARLYACEKAISKAGTKPKVTKPKGTL